MLTLKIPDGCNVGKTIAMVHKCKEPVYLIGDGLRLCLTSLLCRYVAVDKLLRETANTKVSLEFESDDDYQNVKKYLIDEKAA